MLQSRNTIPRAEDAVVARGAATASDGSQAIVRPNGQIISGCGGIEEWEDGDGTVYRMTEEDHRRRAEEHKAVVLAFKAEVTARRVAAARRRMPTMAPPRPRARQHRAAARRQRRLSRSSSRSADPGDDSEAERPLARSFGRLRRLTPGVSGAWRESLAARFPAFYNAIWSEVAALADDEIVRQTEGGRR